MEAMKKNINTFSSEIQIKNDKTGCYVTATRLIFSSIINMFVSTVWLLRHTSDERSIENSRFPNFKYNFAINFEFDKRNDLCTNKAR